jgi:hypothetical protein
MGREVKRVPLDFDWTLEEVWAGYLNPFYGAQKKCAACAGTGSAPMAKLFSEQWCGTAEFDPVSYGATPLTIDHPGVQVFAERNIDRDPEFYLVPKIGQTHAVAREAARLFDHWKRQWCHHLIQADVDALVADGRLWDFTRRWEPGTGWIDLENPVVTADMVNAWSLSGIGHDSINQWICVNARCARDGFEATCQVCQGDGSAWPSNAHKALAENWEDIEPPSGEGYQIWETVSEGSPVSAVFATAEELARWASKEGEEDGSYEQWLKVCEGAYAPSLVAENGVVKTGVASL